MRLKRKIAKRVQVNPFAVSVVFPSALVEKVNIL
jgi:hypothetical protein